MFNFIETGDIQGFQAQMKDYEKSQLVDILNTKNDAGKTMLHVAVAKGSLEFIRLLCEAGASLNEKDAQQQTPLHIAVEKGSYDMVQELLSWGASMTEVDKDGKTPWQYAEENSSEEVYGKMAALLRTRQTWQVAAGSFRFNRVVSLLKNAFPEVKPASGHDKVLFIGRTGAGKSTLLNYLNGIRYTRGMDPETGKPFAKPVEGSPDEPAKVGQGLISQTLYPQVIKKSSLNYVYCDLAGLFDSRGDEERIYAASGVQILSRLPGDIKGIVVVLDLASFYPKGDAFKQTAVALAHMLQKNPDLMNSVYFVITQVPKEVEATLNPDKILTKNVGGILFALKNKAKLQGLDSEELALQFMLEQMQRIGTERILIPKITDLGESRQMMEQKLSNLQAKPANLFNFVSHDDAQEKFNHVLSIIAKSFLSHKMQEENLPKKIDEEQQCQDQIKARIKNLANEIRQREIESATPYDASRINNEIAVMQNRIHNNQNQINHSESILSSLYREVNNLEARMASGHNNDFFMLFINANLSHAINFRRGYIASEKNKIQQLRNENDSLRNAIHAHEIAKIQEEAKLKIRVACLQDEIEQHREWLTVAQLELKNSIEIQQAYERALHDIKVEFFVNEELFAIVYQVSSILDLTSDRDITRFLEEYVKYYPFAEEDFKNFISQQMEIDNNVSQQAPTGYGSLFHFPQVTHNSTQVLSNTQYVRQQGPGF